MTTNAEFSVVLADLIDKRVTGVINEAQLNAGLKDAFDDWGGSYITKAAVALQVQTLITNVDVREEQTRDWWAGTATGGWDVTGVTPGGGHYPITNSLGVTTFKPCPAKILSDTMKGDTGDDARRGISFFAALQFADNELLFLHRCDADGVFELPDCQAFADIPATDTASIMITKNGAPWGTVTWAPGVEIGSINIPSPSVLKGDVLRFTGPLSHDTTLGNVSIVLSGNS